MVLETMDEIFKQVRNTRLNFTIRKPGIAGTKNKVLVTGGPGFLGKRVVESLCEKGYQVRALAKKLSNIDRLEKLNVEIFFGDVADRESLKPAFEDIEYVIHAAADTAGREEDGKLSTIQGTKILSVFVKSSKSRSLSISVRAVFTVWRIIKTVKL